MLREPPKDVVMALQSHDADLSIEWDQLDPCWWFTWKGRRQFAWRHLADNSLALGDLPPSEALDIIRMADMHNHFLDKLKHMERMRAERQYLAGREEEAEAEDAKLEANKVTDFWKRGKQAKPFSLIQNNPLQTGV